MDIPVDGLTFSFPDTWMADTYDAWDFYRNHFGKMWNGIKGVDLVAVDGAHTTWLIEVKDYRRRKRVKASRIDDEVARKVYDTLAALLPAAVNGSDQDEQRLARAALGARRLRVVLHLEQPRKHSMLFPRAIDPAEVKLGLRRLLKPIDAHPVVAEMRAMGALAWSVR
jgi:hypothetical protein